LADRKVSSPSAHQHQVAGRYLPTILITSPWCACQMRSRSAATAANQGANRLRRPHDRIRNVRRAGIKPTTRQSTHCVQSGGRRIFWRCTS
jgi:hypothetical protein